MLVEGFAHGTDGGGVLEKRPSDPASDGARQALGQVLHVSADELESQPVLSSALGHAHYEDSALRVLHD